MPRRAGVRAVQCTPLFSGSGKPVGIFSTHYRKPHRPLECVLQLLDLLTRRGADVIERAQMEASLYESEERFRALVTASSDVVYRTSADWTEMHYLRGNYDGTRGGAASLRIPPNRYDTSLGSQHRARAKTLKNGVFLHLLSCEPPAKLNP